MTLSGTTTFIARTDPAAASLVFVLLDPAAPAAPPVATVTASGSAGNASWTASVNTATVPNGTYSLVARATATGTIVSSAPAAVTIQNAAADDGAEPVAFTVTLPTPGARLSGAAILSATANQPLDGFTFTITGAGDAVSRSLSATSNGVRTVWNANWDTSSVPNGDYALATVAVKAGQETHGEARAFSVENTSVALTVTSPSNNAEVSGSRDIVVAAVPAATSVTVRISSATDDSVASVRNAAFDAARQVWIAHWNTVDFPNGNYRIAARGIDDQGREFLSAPVTVRILNAVQPASPFSVRVVIPAAGATVAGTVPLAAAVSGIAAGVKFFATPANGAVIGIDGRFDAASGRWIGAWRSGDSANGTASIGAVAVNSENVRVESERVHVNVVNADTSEPPAHDGFSVRLLEPADGAVTGRVRFVAETEGGAAEVRFFVRLRGEDREPRTLRASRAASP